jgi:outer membrane receptor protein involved in Fe transport
MKRLIAVAFFVCWSGLAWAQAPAPAAAPDPVVKMDQVDVSATQQTQLNTIDRKVYSLSKDIQAATGSAADVLQNIPSVEVDIDGNVSLRGDSSVQILVDGRSSALLAGASQGDVLSQMPADSIDHIEVITDPSAKYKPDGTGGIINIVLKKKHAPGYSGTVKLTVGNNQRYGASVGGNYNTGKWNFYGNYAVRQDDRPRLATERRNYIDPVTGLPASTQSRTDESSRPFFNIGEGGVDYDPGTHDQLHEVVDLTYRTYIRHALEHNLQEDNLGAPVNDYFRYRYDPEREGQVQSRSTWDHDFGRRDHTLTVEFRAQHHTETELDHYTNLYSVPATQVGPEDIRVSTNEPGTEILAEYANAISKSTEFELGYDRSEDQSYQDYRDLITDPGSGLEVINPAITNSFYLDRTVTAFYGTLRQSWGAFGLLAGGRGEESDVFTNQITSGQRNDRRYFRFYPSLHLSYDLSDTQQLQLNYSHRVRRPDKDDLNPYPQYTDPYNVHEGNPFLQDQQAHSIEAGYQYKNNDTTYLATAFYRYVYNSFTTYSQYINSTTLLTTEANLGKSTSGGIELAATTSPFAKLSLNASGTVYHSQIDASNLGITAQQSAIAWGGKMSADYAWSKTTMFQLNTVYTAKRLTPQGYRLPTYVANIGFRQDFQNKKFSLVVTVSDLFNSLKEETRLNTPVLVDVTTRRRSARIISTGLVYNFGSGKKAKGKTDALQYDSEL